ncbi:hypothetical protein NONO_c48060 [Nocardia nova SH22a]|uniref:DUF3349 domain-containing protein n=1 Tax=Nocardia nova SH22a TaxID=1415166 RepID=W5TJQ5_9NOCA|nr:DUF3349 domain-containing protein [Nocardia nova]AHH19590.1 hypothetical protein NONO_c48060 [Nocardia nova SH22a]
MALSGLLAKIVEWLRTGYPQGVPDTDYVPLLALLARRLSHAEIQQVAEELRVQGTLPADKADAGVVITRLTDGMPRESDLVRVRDHLVSAGWPVDENWLD